MTGKGMVHTVGILGGIASGKSLVSECLARNGASVFDADKAGHDALKEPEVKQALQELWGEDIFDSHGEVDRGALGRIVFAPPPAGPEALQQLEAIVHLVIERNFEGWIQDLPEKTTIVVLDAAIMLEAGWDKYCDSLVFVDTPVAQRIEQAIDRGWTKAQFHAREATQMSLSDKRRQARWIIDNSGTAEQTAAKVDQVWEQIVSRNSHSE